MRIIDYYRRADIVLNAPLYPLLLHSTALTPRQHFLGVDSTRLVRPPRLQQRAVDFVVAAESRQAAELIDQMRSWA